MTFTIYVAPEGVKDLLHWLRENLQESDIPPSLWLQCRVKLVTPATPGWVPIHVDSVAWWTIRDNFNVQILTP